MPADRGSESVFGDQSLLQFRGREPREIGSFLTQRQKKSGNVCGATDLAFVDVVMQPERDHSPLAEIAVEFVFPEIQLAKMFQEFGLFLGRYKRRPISEPLRKRGQRLEKTELTIKHVSLDKGGCRRCERMSDISPDELASAIVRDAVQRYIESRRRRIDSFVDRHFTFGGSVALHRRAPGWDLLRAHAVTLSSALAAVIAQQMAIAAFPFGASLGGLWYSLFPATAGPELLTATTAGVFPRRRHAGRLFRRGHGSVAAPTGPASGQAPAASPDLGGRLCGEPGRNRLMREHYVARLIDIFDLIALAMRVSHA